MGFALLWLLLAAALLVRAVRRGMGYSMTWWAFTFPLGTCVTGATALSRHTGLDAATWLAAGLYVLLAAGWLAAATGTLRSFTRRAV
jgi:tellurite resistance protein TehA-like permease